MTPTSRWLCAISLLACSSSFLQAQVITSGQYERGLSISGPLTNGYVPFPERYFYNTGPYLYLNGNPRQIIYLDYLDKLDRAQKFGYRVPVNPFFNEPPPVEMTPDGRAVVAPSPPRFGFWRRHQQAVIE